MGAEFDWYNTTLTDKEDIRKEFASHQQNECDELGSGTYQGHLGIKPGLTFPNVLPFNSQKEAIEYIEDNNDKWGDAYAVPYKTIGDVESAARKQHREKLDKLRKRVQEFPKQCLVKRQAAKSKTIGCKGCGSQIARRYLKATNCPICGRIHAFMTESEFKQHLKNQAAYEAFKSKPKPPTNSKKGKTIAYVVGGACPS